MNRDDIFDDGKPRGSDFTFDAEVAAVFDNMISRSVPFYAEQQRMIVEVVKRYWRPTWWRPCPTSRPTSTTSAAPPAQR